MTQPVEFVEVATRSGVVRGRWKETTGEGANPRSAAFLGIPFAEPPIGDLRFQAPVKKEPWTGTLDALEFGATAQRGDPGVTLIPEPSIPGESTLNVNVFTPSPKKAEAGTGLPVLVWIHGGGYFAGSPASPWYDGRNFNRDNVVTVTASYRLGFDGFGWVEGAPANRGVLDWMAALQWVQDNIADFGGDPGRVTIAGQSAGGGAVLTLLGVEAAQDLFHQVYAISSPIPDVSTEAAKEFAAKMAEKLGVSNDLAGFSSVSEEKLLEVQKELSNLDPSQMEKILKEGLSLGPVVDGTLIPRRTIDSIKKGVGADKHLVIGATDDEFTMALAEMESKLKWVPKPLLLRQLGVPKKARKAYLAANKDVVEAGNYRLGGRILTDRMFKVPMLEAIAARRNAPTWVYRFAWPSGTFGFAEHCLDVPFFFDCLDGPAMAPLAGDAPPQCLADELHHAAVQFIRTGDPGWPRYIKKDRVVRVWDVPSQDVPNGFASVYPLVG
ncbi:carboxylesterase/lipase family protein [Actinomyces minihominis]|uniref:carboxylesterase/lipase family protein n=1 Tax=Actinomyces minihominis TaxID=2002838 RepID=UPI000C07F385|nr:carboxylesterase family protein [Actinomyces minihominis]